MTFLPGAFRGILRRRGAVGREVEMVVLGARDRLGEVVAGRRVVSWRGDFLGVLVAVALVRARFAGGVDGVDGRRVRLWPGFLMGRPLWW